MEVKFYRKMRRRLNCGNLKDAIAQYVILQMIDQFVKLHKIVTCVTSTNIYISSDTVISIYNKDSTQQTCSLLQDFYNYKILYNQVSHMVSNIAYVQDIAFKLNKQDQKVDDVIIIMRTLNIFPDSYKHFSSSWDLARAEEDS